jgi:hypothetical protein
VLSGATGALGQVLAGIATGLQFNPLSSAISAALAAALSGYRRAPRSRAWWSAAVLLAGWTLGDGIRLAGSSASWPYLLAWALAGLAFGYALPAFAGAYIGRLVHWGTGWLAAGAVALMLVPALSTLADVLSSALWRVIA